MSDFPDRITSLLGKALDLRLSRQQVLSANVANADTPGYTPVDLKFQRALESAMPIGRLSVTSEKHLQSMGLSQDGPELEYDPGGQPGLDGNTVVLDRELAKIAENTIQYNATARALQKKIGMLRYAVSEGGA